MRIRGITPEAPKDYNQDSREDIALKVYTERTK